MSRTYRVIPKREPDGDIRTFAQKARDGETSISKMVIRDNRVTGLRDHKTDRAKTRQKLRDEEERETVRAGKTRRYTDRYGAYDL